MVSYQSPERELKKMENSEIHNEHVQSKNSKSLRENIYNQIIKEIGIGRINAGEKLLESELAKRFNVSRTPVREALLQLEKKGLIEYKRNRGAIVQKISKKQIDEIYDILSVLEAYATELTAQKIGSEEIKYLESIYSEMEEIKSNPGNYLKYLEKNTEFHLFFARKAGNETLYQTICDLRNRFHRTIYLALTIPIHLVHYQEYHRRIIEALIKAQPSEAKILMKNHIQEGKLFLADAFTLLPSR